MADAVSLIHAYTRWLTTQPLSLNTQRLYRVQVQRYGVFLQTYEPPAGDPLSEPLARDLAVHAYKTYLKTVNHVKPATVNTALAAIDHFYRYLALPAAHVRREILPHQAPQALTRPEQHRLLRTLDYWPSVRDRAVVLLLFYTGIRVSECAALDCGDVQLSTRRGRVIIRNGKGGQYREIPLNRQVRPCLTAWLHERATMDSHPDEPALFLARSGQRLSVRAIHLIFERLNKVTGIQCSAHTLRHTCLTNLVRQGTDLVLVADIAGHRRLDTTRRYTLPTDTDREQAMERLVSSD